MGSASRSTPSRRQRAMRGAQQGRRGGIVVVVHDPDERNDVGAFRQSILEKIAAVCLGAPIQAQRFEALRRAFGDGRQIEQHEFQVGGTLRGFDQERALAASDVEQATVPGSRDRHRESRRPRGAGNSTSASCIRRSHRRRAPQENPISSRPSTSRARSSWPGRRAAVRPDRGGRRTADCDVRSSRRRRDCRRAPRPGRRDRSARPARRSSRRSETAASSRRSVESSGNCNLAAMFADVSGPCASRSNNLRRTQANKICEYTKPAQTSNKARCAIPSGRPRQGKRSRPALETRTRKPAVTQGE